MMTQLEANARADNLMDEIDGPARAYFHIPIQDLGGGNYQMIQIVYVTLIWPITREDVEDDRVKEVAGELSKAIQDELFKLGGGIIWWRSRPKLESFESNKGPVFKVRCRVATSPPLDPKTWEALHLKREGEHVAL
jgi:hypothetical protein